MTIQLNLTDDQLQEMAAASIAAAIGPEQRETLVTEALKALFEKRAEHRYGEQPSSPIHDAFIRAMVKEAEKVAEELIQADEEIVAKVRSIMTEAIEKALVVDREKVVSALAQSITNAMFKLDEEKY